MKIMTLPRVILLSIVLCLSPIFPSNAGTWVRVNKDLPASIGSVYSFFYIDGLFYMGTYTGLYKSLDKGVTWVALPMGPDKNNDITSLVKMDGKLYAGGASIYRSADNGETWKAIPIRVKKDITIQSLIAIHGILYAGTWGGAGVYKSNDQGDTWVAINHGEIPKSILATTFLSVDGVLYVGSAGTSGSYSNRGSGVYKSTDQGNSWKVVGANFNADWVHSLIDVHGTLYAGVWTAYGRTAIYKMLDHRSCWKAVLTMPQEYISVQSLLNFNGALYASGSFPHADILRSTDNGITWSDFSAGLHLKHMIIKQIFSVNGTLYAGARLALFKYSDTTD